MNSGPTLAIATASPSDLLIGGTVTAANWIAITDANQTLEIGASGTLDTGTSANETITNGTIKMDGGTIDETAGLFTLQIGAGAT